MTDKYLTAHNTVNAMLKRGEIRAYSCSFERGMGRSIYVETDQGWNPSPFYCDLWECGE